MEVQQMRRLEFFDEVHDFQHFVSDNMKLIGNYTIISEQLYLRNNETGIIDMLAVDNDEKRLVILELKNCYTTDKAIWQPIRYYDLIRRGEDSLRMLLIQASHKLEFDISEIDLNPKLVLVVPECNDQLLRTMSYFADIDSLVVEIQRWTNGSYIELKKQTYKPLSIFHKNDIVEVQEKVSKTWSLEEYRRMGISSDKIDIASRIIAQIRGAFINKGFKLDIFYNETKITLAKDGKVWGHLFVKQNPLDYRLTMSFKVNKDVIVNNGDFSYALNVEQYDQQKNGIKLKLTGPIPQNIISKYV
jgi:hypothetical protein